MNTLALIGGEEFAPGFENVHAELVELAGKPKPRVVFLPTAASHDGARVAQSWCDRARKLLGNAGATVDAPLVIDRAGANDAQNAALLDNADMIYLGGGWPHILIQTLAGTRILDAFWRAVQRGAMIAGASAGAMALAERTLVVNENVMHIIALALSGAVGTPMPKVEFIDGYNLVPHAIVSPHFERMPQQTKLYERGFYPAGLMLLGIDEQTALVRRENEWRVLGKGAVTIGKDKTFKKYRAGNGVNLYD
jgi:cyanophycinase